MKNTQKYTQGPWNVYLYGKDSYGRTIATVGANDGNNRICELCAVDLPVDSIEANAKLIAAAPDLLDEARLSITYLELALKAHDYLTTLEHERLVRLRALVTKAEGIK